MGRPGRQSVAGCWAGDAADVLRQLIDDVSSQSSGRSAAEEARVVGLRREHGYFDAPSYNADDAPLLPQRVIGELTS
jgi:acetolactate synthase I/II/III large subunit